MDVHMTKPHWHDNTLKGGKNVCKVFTISATGLTQIFWNGPKMTSAYLLEI